VQSILSVQIVIFHVSNANLNRLFLRHTGLTPMKYLQKMRVDAARMMLASSGMRIREISDALGFNTPKYFCEVFRQQTGMSPRGFRTKDAPDAEPDGRSGHGALSLT